MRNDSETTLSPAECRDLRCIAGMMIPASTEFGVPGADDDIIFADIVKSLGRDLGHVREALGGCCELAGGAFADLDAARREAVAASFRASGGGGGGDTLARDPAMLLSRRPGGALAGAGAAAAISEGAHAGAGRLVAARSGAGAAEDVA